MMFFAIHSSLLSFSINNLSGAAIPAVKNIKHLQPIITFTVEALLYKPSPFIQGDYKTPVA
jgi:hypothetical protein